jgi:hypothetical protein
MWRRKRDEDGEDDGPAEDLDPEDADAWDDARVVGRARAGARETVPVAPSRLRGVGDAFERGRYAGAVVQRDEEDEGDEEEEEADGEEEEAEEDEEADAEEEERERQAARARAAGQKRARPEERGSELQLMSRGAQSEGNTQRRAARVLEQVRGIEGLLRFRVQLQPVLERSHRLPRGRETLRELESSDDAVRQECKRLRRNAAGLCADLLELQRASVERDCRDAGLRRAVDANGADPEGAGLLPQTHFEKGSVSRLDATWRAVDTLWERVAPWTLQAADKEHERIALSVSSNAAVLRSMFAPPSAQVEQILSDPERAARKTHLPRSSAVRPIGGSDGGDDGPFDRDTFDDRELFQALTREWSASSTAAALSAVRAAANTVAAAAAARKGGSKHVYPKERPNHRLSYEVHPKLVNFLAARPLAKPTQDVDTLVRSIFHTH